MARELLEIGDLPKAAVAGVIEEMLKRKHPPLLAGWVAEGLVGQFPIPDMTGLTQVARALQILGILLCSFFDDLANCPCLRDLTGAVSKETAAGTVEREFGAWVPVS